MPLSYRPQGVLSVSGTGVIAGVEAENRASIRVLEKSGFVLGEDIEESEELTFVVDFDY